MRGGAESAVLREMFRNLRPDIRCIAQMRNYALDLLMSPGKQHGSVHMPPLLPRSMCHAKQASPLSRSALCTARKASLGQEPADKEELSADSPERMVKRRRLLSVISTRIARDEYLVRRKYMVNHPVVRLLERNMRNIDVREMFLNERGFEDLKEFHGLAQRLCGNDLTRFLGEVPPFRRAELRATGVPPGLKLRLNSSALYSN